MKDNLILTIGRQYGSGGLEIGRLLSEKLGIPCYDKELVTKAAKGSYISEEFFNEFETLSKLAKELYNFAYNLGWVSLTEASNKDIKTELTREKNILANI